MKVKAAAAGEKSVSPASTDGNKVSHLLLMMKHQSQDCLIIILPFIQEQDEATQEVNTTVQEFYCQTEKKSSRSEGSEEDEDEGHGEKLPLSIST